jgi:hypothetical protein
MRRAIGRQNETRLRRAIGVRFVKDQKWPARSQTDTMTKADIRAKELSRLGPTALPKPYQAVTLNGAFGETPCLVQISIESVR